MKLEELTFGTPCISKNSSGCGLLIGHKKCFVLLCPIGEQFLLSSFREFVYDDNDCLPWRSAVDHKQLIHLWSTAGLFRFFFSNLEFYANCVWNHENFGGKIINSFL